LILEVLEQIRAVSRELLELRAPDGRSELWLWEHGWAIADLAHGLADAPEFSTQAFDRNATVVAGVFGLSGWAAQVNSGELKPWQVLARPTTGVQRETAATLMREHLQKLLAPEVLNAAVEAVRQSGDRYTDVAEARILAEAENVADMGVVSVLRQYRQYVAEGRPLSELLAKWQRLKEYQFWDARLNNSLRTETGRELAKKRLAAADQVLALVSVENNPTNLPAADA
jgi:hypothetical protein